MNPDARGIDFAQRVKSRMDEKGRQAGLEYCVTLAQQFPESMKSMLQELGEDWAREVVSTIDRLRTDKAERAAALALQSRQDAIHRAECAQQKAQRDAYLLTLDHIPEDATVDEIVWFFVRELGRLGCGGDPDACDEDPKRVHIETIYDYLSCYSRTGYDYIMHHGYEAYWAWANDTDTCDQEPWLFRFMTDDMGYETFPDGAEDAVLKALRSLDRAEDASAVLDSLREIPHAH